MISNTVCVVIPTFNSAATIERALKSVANQTRLPTEVLVIDNASTDSTAELVLRFAQATPQLSISLIQQTENLGPGQARNIGWERSTASLIAFLDSDDTWHPQKIEMQLQVVESHPDHVLFGHSYDIVSNEVQETMDSTSARGDVRYYSLGHFLFRNRLSTPTVIVRRDTPYRFPHKPWFAEDFALWTQIVAGGQKAVFLNQPLTHLHKAAYGASGLSARVSEMHKGELAALKALHTTYTINMLQWITVKLWMQLKYLRRIAESKRHD